MSEKFLSDADAAAIRKHYREVVPKKQRLTDGEVDLLLAVAERRQLMPQPFGNQLHAMLRSSREQDDRGEWRYVSRLSIEPGIDGLRLLAERTGKYVGSGVPEYQYDKDGRLERAIVTVEKIAPDGSRAKISADAWFSEYAQYAGGNGNKRLTRMWAEKEHMMTGKCAESAALRKAFPQLSGLYTPEEMGGSEDDGADDRAAPREPAKEDRREPERTPERQEQREPGRRQDSPRQEAAREPEKSLPSDQPKYGEVSADKRSTLANALAMACSAFNVPKREMLELVRGSAGRDGVITDAGGIAAISSDEYAAIVSAFKEWEKERREKRANGEKKAGERPEDVAEREADKWERGEAKREAEKWERSKEDVAPISEDDIPF
jgi:phage recombination protein Bet